MAFQLELLNQWQGASFLTGPEDLVPSTAFRILANARIDRARGVPTGRPGSTVFNAVIDATFPIILAIYKLAGVSASFHYTQMTNGADSRIYRLNVAAGTQALVGSPSGTALMSQVNWVDGKTAPWTFMAGPWLRKDNGTTLQTFGVAPPTAAPQSVALGTRGRVAIHACDALGAWVGTNVSGLAIDAAVRQEGTGSLSFSVALATLGTISTPLTGTSSVRQGTHTGANGATSLTDAAANFTTLPVRQGSWVYNVTQAFLTNSPVTRITNTQLFFDGGLSGQVFNNADTYYILFDLKTFRRVAGNATGTDNSGVNAKTTSLVDTTKDFVREGVTAGMVLWNRTNGSSGTITSIGTTTNTHDTLNVSGTFAGGTPNTANQGDAYSVFNELVVNDDWVHLWVWVDNPTNLLYLQVDIDVDNNNFQTRWFSRRISVNELSGGAGQWTELFLRKSSFTPFLGLGGIYGFDTSWAVRIRVQTNPLGAVTVKVDDISLLGGVGIEGPCTYTAIYVNETTGGMSSPPRTDADLVIFTVPTTTVPARHPMVLTLTAIASPADTQVTHLWIYRKQPSILALPTLVGQVPVGTTTFTDDRAVVQLDLTQTLEPDNDVPPSDLTVLFGPGAIQRLFGIRGRNKVRYTKQWQQDRCRAENWPKTFEFQIGDGSEVALNGLVSEQNILVWSDKQAWQVLGQGPDAFLPLPITNSRGLAAADALDFGDGQVFKLCLDGVFSQVGGVETELTGDIRPFFLGQTVNGQPGINSAALATCRLRWFPHQNGNEVVLLYPEGNSGSPNRRLVLKKNHLTGQYTDCHFDSTTGVAGRALFSDHQTLTLLMGGGDGALYQLEVDTATDDAGTAIAGRVRTGAYDQGQPRRLKTYHSVVGEVLTGGDPVTVVASFNRSNEAIAMGTISGTLPASLAQLTVPAGRVSSVQQRRNIALDCTWSSALSITIPQLGWYVQVEPEAILRYDTGAFQFDVVHVLRMLLLDVDTPATLTVQVSVDGTVRDTRVVFATSGRNRVNHYLPMGLKGKVMQVVCTSGTLFQVWGIVAVVKPVGRMVGYSEITLTSL